MSTKIERHPTLKGCWNVLAKHQDKWLIVAQTFGTKRDAELVAAKWAKVSEVLQ